MRHHRGLALAVLVVAALAVSTARGTVLGIDLGSQWATAYLLQSGEDPVAVHDGQRVRHATTIGWYVDSPTEPIFAYKDRTRLAAAFTDSLVILGRKFGEKDLEHLQTQVFTVEEDVARGTPVLSVQGERYSSEELVGLFLRFIKDAAEAQSGNTVEDCVITIDPFASLHQRQALLDAAKIAGLNVISLISASAAFVFRNVLQRDGMIEDHQSLVVDFGGSSFKAALLHYSPPPRHSFNLGELKVLNAAWDAELGGRDIDNGIAMLIADEVAKIHKEVDPYNDHILWRKIITAAITAKLALTSKNEHEVVIKAVTPDSSFRYNLTRERLNMLCDQIFQKLPTTIQAALATPLLNATKFVDVSFFGDVSKMPWVQVKVHSIVNKSDVYYSITEKDGAAMGAMYYGAMLTSTVDMPQVELVDLFPFKITAVAEGQEPQTVFENAPFGAEKNMTLHKDGGRREFAVDLKYAEPASESQSLNTVCREVARYTVSGLPATEVDIHLRWNITTNGLVVLQEAFLLDGDKNTALPFTKSDLCLVHLTPAQLQAAKDRVAKLSEGERSRLQRENALTALTQLLSQLKSLEDASNAQHKVYRSVTSKDERSAIKQAVRDAEDFVEYNAEYSSVEEARDAIGKLHAVAHRALFRMNEKEELPKAVEHLTEALRASARVLDTAVKTADLPDDEFNVVVHFVHDTQEWLDDMSEADANRASDSEPLYTSLEVAARTAALEHKMNALMRKAAPKAESHEEAEALLEEAKRKHEERMREFEEEQKQEGEHAAKPEL
eukprot:TRINITY_DN4823_c0_g1_i1.p1 TRINITY_DN4823_c0_g1~~TRINITY_DN4823_c0_g1_i1.p1  ORF type:complete len:791 (-),score=239.93 TRINITY_DN4823_c0_g1_i1:138-2483(-)